MEKKSSAVAATATALNDNGRTPPYAAAKGDQHAANFSAVIRVIPSSPPLSSSSRATKEKKKKQKKMLVVVPPSVKRVPPNRSRTSTAPAAVGGGESESGSQKSVTLVSALLDIGRAQWPRYGRSLANYHHFFRLLLQLRVPVCINTFFIF
jgi:hypothetical protein